MFFPPKINVFFKWLYSLFFILVIVVNYLQVGGANKTKPELGALYPTGKVVPVVDLEYGSPAGNFGDKRGIDNNGSPEKVKGDKDKKGGRS